MTGAKVLEAALRRAERAPSNDLSNIELRVITAAKPSLQAKGHDNDFENDWSNDNPDSWYYPD